MGNMKQLALLLILGAVIVISGCTSTPAERGTVEILVSDQPSTIDDFTYLNVKLSEIRVFKAGSDFETYSPTVDSFDLTKLKGDDALGLINVTLDEGKYTKIEFHVESIEGETTSGTVDVQVPSNKLMITKNFDVEANKTVTFVFDINVVNTGQTDRYNLLPVISESGIVGKDIPASQVRRVTREQAKAHVKGQPDGQTPPGNQTPPSPPGSGGETGGTTGQFSLFVTDAPADIGDFSSLMVDISKIRIHKTQGGKWLEFTPNITDFDLTGLVDGNMLEVLNVDLETGMYSQIVLEVSSADGTLVNQTNGTVVQIMVPSDSLKIIKPFMITDGGDVEFIFDINVVRKGQSTNYNLKPVIGKSGVKVSPGGGGGSEPVCGNGQCEVDEDNQTCPSDCIPQPPTNDTNQTNVTQPICGDDSINGNETCDGTDLDSVTCIDLGYTGGTLACASDCSFDVTACVNETNTTNTTICGDGTCDPDEDYLNCSADCPAPAPVCVPEINCTSYCDDDVLFENGTCVNDACVFDSVACQFGCANATACDINQTA
jgi:hypothetical protein